MMLDWNEYRQQLKDTIVQIARLSPDTVRGYSHLSAAGSKTNHLDPKTRELIALAVAVALRCDGCITVHTDAAIKQGASKEEVSEALGVAVSINAGAALVYSARVIDAYQLTWDQPRRQRSDLGRSLYQSHTRTGIHWQLRIDETVKRTHSNEQPARPNR